MISCTSDGLKPYCRVTRSALADIPYENPKSADVDFFVACTCETKRV